MVAADHERVVRRLQAQFRSLPPGSPVRLAKRTSNLFRPRERAGAPGLDVSGLDQVLVVDPVTRTAVAGGMTTYERLLDATLEHGLMPMVVPQLKTITLGGSVTGLGIESSSWRRGLPHESVLSMDVLTGTGDVITTGPTGPELALFHAFPNSYGTLGYAIRLTIELDPVQPFVHVRHVRFDDLDLLTAAIAEIVDRGQWQGTAVDFIDGTVFTETEAYLSLGSWASTAPYTSDYTGQRIYYRSIRERDEDWLTVRDYLWRWDTDWFWCSRAFGVQNPRIRRWVPRRWLRSDRYQKLVGLENRWHVMARLDARRGRAARERVVQDVEIPLGRTADFLRWFIAEVPIEPIWLCPLRLRRPVAGTGDGQWPLCPLAPESTYVNVGFWSTVAIEPGSSDGDVNRRIENMVSAHDGHKSLYSDAYYSPQEFWNAYGEKAYRAAKERYDPTGRLLDLYEKAVRRK